jgi:CubicO group peptidase (beta-lactamase class C family)
MNRKYFYWFACCTILLLTHLISCDKNATAPGDTNTTPEIIGDYLGQTPPESPPILFSPEIFTGNPEMFTTPVFSPDLTEVYWTYLRTDCTSILSMKYIDGEWSGPMPVFFQNIPFKPVNVSLSPDGEQMFFLASQPISGAAEAGDLWFSTRNEKSWNDPQPVSAEINAKRLLWKTSVATNGNIYFSARESTLFNIYMSHYVNGEYAQPEIVAFSNTLNNEYNPYVAPDESYVIFNRSEGNGIDNLFISFKNEDGTWSQAIRLGDEANSFNYHEKCPCVSPDGKYLFFISNREGLSRIYWMAAQMIDDLKTTASSMYSYQIPQQTDDGWETANLSKVGMEKNSIENLVNSILDEDYTEVHSVVIIKENKLVFEEYFPGHWFRYSDENFHGALINFHRDYWHNTHSATKSITSALVGIAIDKGFINSVDDKIFSYFDNYAHLKNEQNDKITVEHLLSMNSGFEWNEWDVDISGSDHDIVQFNTSSDPVGYVLAKPVVTEPGESFCYNGGTVDLLGEIVHIASGSRVDAFSEQYLFGPLGIDRFKWQRLPSGLIVTHGDVYITPRDMAKFGYLFLNKGVWNGEQIISQTYVEKSLTEYFSLPYLGWADGYGYLWWFKSYTVNNQSYNSFFAEGWGGQKIAVFPDLNMVVVFTGANYVLNPPCDDILTRFVLPALTE